MKSDRAPNLDGVGLFVFSDPGGAKAILAKALELKSKGNVLYIISDRKYNFFGEFSLPVDNVPKNIECFIQDIKPDYIFTGTSYTSNIELQFLILAKKNNIPSFSFIDHWTNFKSRFFFNDQYIYPDTVLVIDEKAKGLAILDGINEDRLVVYNNPYYQYLKTFQPELDRDSFFSKYGINVSSKKIIVFAPDPLSNINGLSVYGFDELIATKEIAAVIDEIKGDFLFCIKFHPNQNVKRIEELTSSRMMILDSSVDNNTLIYYADLIIGFFSNFLVEANIMNKKTLRFHLNNVINDPLSGQNIGRIVGLIGLKSEIEELVGL